MAQHRGEPDKVKVRGVQHRCDGLGRDQIAGGTLVNLLAVFHALGYLLHAAQGPSTQQSRGGDHQKLFLRILQKRAQDIRRDHRAGGTDGALREAGRSGLLKFRITGEKKIRIAAVPHEADHPGKERAACHILQHQRQL